MIELVFSGMCERCDRAELEVISWCTFSGGNMNAVVCKHENACVRMKEQLEESAKDDPITE